MIIFRDDTHVAYRAAIACLIMAGLGYVPNPLIGPDGLFLTNAQHNELNAAAGALLLLGGFILYGKATLLLIGTMYVLLGIAGYHLMEDTTMLYGFAINLADHYLHLLVGIVFIAAGAVVKPYKPPRVPKAKAGKKKKK